MANDHQLFEEWLFSDKDTPHHDLKTMEEHREMCDPCQQLSIAWAGVEDELQSASMISPSSGFTERWQMRFAADRNKRQRKQNIAILLLSAGGAATLLIVSSLLIIPLFKSPWPFILTWTYQLASLYSISSIYGGALTILIRSVVKLIPSIFWVTFPLALGALLVIWLFFYQKVLLSRRIML
jgi:hypothetical protein